jgi:16S rRNA (cytidine1402-2'-O)-methyltransferase
MTKPGKLYLIPNVIADETQAWVIPNSVRDILPRLRYFLVEDIRTARRYLSSLKIVDSIEALHFEVLDKNTNQTEIAGLFKPVMEGFDIGVISESGCPGVADPGALAVKFAHEHRIQVIPLVGPSSILLALMASGLSGQHFAFHGYLPIQTTEVMQAIKSYERESKQKDQTQLFIETPYRNNQLFNSLLKALNNTTLLCVAMDVTGSQEYVRTQTVDQWKKTKVDWPKLPAVFLFHAK